MTNRGNGPRPGLARVARRVAVALVVLVIAVTAASFGYNLATGGQVPRPPGLTMVKAGGFDTRYRSWGTSGSPIVLVPGAFETADTFALLGAALGTDHRVFAVDLTGTGYSQPSPPFSASHLADQVLAFLRAEGLTGRNAPVLVGHSSGAAVAGLAALQSRGRDRRGLPRRRCAPAAERHVGREPADRPLPDEPRPAGTQQLVAHPHHLRLPVRPVLPTADRRGGGRLAPAAPAARIRCRAQLHAAPRHPRHDQRPAQLAAGQPRCRSGSSTVPATLSSARPLPSGPHPGSAPRRRSRYPVIT